MEAFLNMGLSYVPHLIFGVLILICTFVNWMKHRKGESHEQEKEGLIVTELIIKVSMPEHLKRCFDDGRLTLDEIIDILFSVKALHCEVIGRDSANTSEKVVINNGSK